ncbi:MAG TPA: glycosyltransferase, partial [Terriglobia bacterium]|nr:glycosyltransferase [Terriglobia bacterium]
TRRALPDAPAVSILVAARNEEDALPATLDSLLRLDYPAYDIVVVDDASSDRTGAIAEEYARRAGTQGRLKVIHNRELPAGWSGKVHAFSLASKAATGEWVLATDADIVFHPATLRLAMALALEKQVQLLSLSPQIDFRTFWEKVVLPAFTLLISTLYPLRLVNSPRSSRAIAAGAFILMRREDLEAVGGYERLRNVVIEDARMAQLFKSHGRRILFAVAGGLLRTRMYSDCREMWDGLSRSAFEGTGFSLAKVLLGLCGSAVVAVLPWVLAPVLGMRDVALRRPIATDHTLLLALGACLAGSLFYGGVLRILRVPVIYVFTLPLATLFYQAVAVNSALLTLSGRGVPWKGRNYPQPAREDTG